MKSLLLLLFASASFGVELQTYEVPEKVAADFAAAFPGVEYFPTVKLAGQVTPSVPEEVRGHWFRVRHVQKATIEVAEEWAEIGKSSISIKDGETIPLDHVETVSDNGKLVAVILYRAGGVNPAADVVRPLPGGLVAVNQFYTKTGKLVGRTEIYAVK